METDKLLEIMKVVKTSTGLSEEFTPESICKRLIEFNRLKKQIKESEDILREELLKTDIKFPYELNGYRITKEEKNIYEQDCKKIFKQLPEDIFWNACSISKTKLPKLADKENSRKFIAIVDANSTIINTTESLVIRNIKE
jgi:hypothetical protein